MAAGQAGQGGGGWAGLYVAWLRSRSIHTLSGMCSSGQEGGGGAIFSGPGTAARDHDYRLKFTGVIQPSQS